MHGIKLSRAWALSNIPAMPMVRSAIADSISPMLIDNLTARELAEVINSLNAHWHKAVTHTDRAICDEGAVWDDRRSSLPEIAQ